MPSSSTPSSYAHFPGPSMDEEPAGHFAMTVAAIFWPGVVGTWPDAGAVCAAAATTKPNEEIIAAAAKRIILWLSITGSPSSTPCIAGLRQVPLPPYLNLKILFQNDLAKRKS